MDCTICRDKGVVSTPHGWADCPNCGGAEFQLDNPHMDDELTHNTSDEPTQNKVDQFKRGNRRDD